MVHLTLKDEEVVNQLSFDHRVSILAAVYTAYVELTPSNKKPVSQREFFQRYKDNWNAFANIENDSYDED
ncbi:hypothetical protein GCM10027176_36260 [Actinoallomurus bryophytorum]